ncbi:hypothetical protein K501DRAFT_333837 [Backusella circina FSU 941]|nr:hypothetical protein K501DRAFT_333837 [Backusella circina FSU 941]
MPSMAAESMAFVGPITFAKNQAWNGMTELGELCLCTSQTVKPSSVYKVTFQCNAVVPLAAIKLFMLKSERWRAYDMSGNRGLALFFASVFEETIDSYGPSVKGLVVKVNQDTVAVHGYPLKPNLKLLVYTERQYPGEKLSLYAQPIYAHDEFTSVYHLEDLADFSETMSQNGESISVIQMLGQALPVLTESNKEESEMDMIKDIEMNIKQKRSNAENRDLFKMDKNSTNIRKRPHSKPVKTIFNSHTKKPIPKKTMNPSKSSKEPLPVEEKKMMIKKLIKETLIQLDYDKKSDETSQLFQQIYLSIRYAFRNVFSTCTELDEKKLKYIIKLHVDFYTNLDALIDIFHPVESGL